MIYVMGVFIVCYMLLVLFLIFVWFGVIFMGRKLFLFLFWIGLMVLVNFCLDLFIYCWCENCIRRGIIYLL